MMNKEVDGLFLCEEDLSNQVDTFDHLFTNWIGKNESKKIGYRTDHIKWAPISAMKKFETDLGNSWFDDSGKEAWEVIWVTHSKKDAKKYGDDIREVDLSGAELLMSDGDGGHLYGRPSRAREGVKKVDNQQEQSDRRPISLTLGPMVEGTEFAYSMGNSAEREGICQQKQSSFSKSLRATNQRASGSLVVEDTSELSKILKTLYLDTEDLASFEAAIKKHPMSQEQKNSFLAACQSPYLTSKFEWYKKSVRAEDSEPGCYSVFVRLKAQRGFFDSPIRAIFKMTYWDGHPDGWLEYVDLGLKEDMNSKYNLSESLLESKSLSVGQRYELSAIDNSEDFLNAKEWIEQLGYEPSQVMVEYGIIPASETTTIKHWLRDKISKEGKPDESVVDAIGKVGKIENPIVLDSDSEMTIEGRHRLAAALKYGLDVPVFDLIWPDSIAEGARGNWAKEGYSISHRLVGDKIKVFALDKDGNEVGAAFFVEKRGVLKNAPAHIVSIKEPHQRKGLATAIYRYAELLTGKKIKPGMTTGAGAKLWSQPNRPFGEAKEPFKYFFGKEGYSQVQSSYVGSDPHVSNIGAHRSGHAYTFLPHRIKFYIERNGVPDFIHVITSKKGPALKAVYAEKGKDMIQLWSYVDTRMEPGWKAFEKQAHDAGYKIKDFRKGSVEDRHGYWLSESKLEEKKKQLSDLPKRKRELLKKWQKLVNMGPAAIQKYLDSEDGKSSGLSKKEASKLKIKRGRDSARAIIRMKKKGWRKWTPADWRWAGRQVSFISRMRGSQGPLMKDGKKTEKLKSLLIWGHRPESKEGASNLSESKNKKIKGIADWLTALSGADLKESEKKSISKTEKGLKKASAKKTKQISDVFKWVSEQDNPNDPVVVQQTIDRIEGLLIEPTESQNKGREDLWKMCKDIIEGSDAQIMGKYKPTKHMYEDQYGIQFKVQIGSKPYLVKCSSTGSEKLVSLNLHAMNDEFIDAICTLETGGFFGKANFIHVAKRRWVRYLATGSADA